VTETISSPKAKGMSGPLDTHWNFTTGPGSKPRHGSSQWLSGKSQAYLPWLIVLIRI